MANETEMLSPSYTTQWTEIPIASF
ncbi:DUF4113 domain-containing protein [Escherichia coli]|nr:DUF4113 domain-containing protein [Escherichia coli]